MAKRRKVQPNAEPDPLGPALHSSELLHFIYEDGFLQDCKDLGLLEEDIHSIEIQIMTGGKNSPVIEGTGGLRKMRFAPSRWKVGKSGAARVCFVFFERHGIVYMITVYSKSEQDDLSAKAKAIFRRLIREAEAELARRMRPAD